MNTNQLSIKFDQQCSKVHKILRDIERDIDKKHFVSAEIEFSLLNDEIAKLAEICNEKRKLHEESQNVS